MGTYNSALIPASTGLTLGTNSQQWDAYIQNLHLSGVFNATAAINAYTLNGTPYADQFAGANIAVKIQAAHDSLPSAGGVIDATGFTGNQIATQTVTISKRVLLLLGGVTWIGPANAAVITVTIDSVRIEGTNRGITTLQSAITQHGIDYQLSGGVTVAKAYLIQNLKIASQGTATAGAGINIQASSGVNSFGSIRNVVTSACYNGINLQRSITTQLDRVESSGAINDGIVLNGNGTSTLLNNCYSHGSGRYNYHQYGMTYIHYNNCASDLGGSANYYFERDQTGSTLQPIGVTMTGCGSESSLGKGIYILDGLSFNIIGCRILSSAGHGIHFDGCRDSNIIGSYITGNGTDGASYGIAITTSATPVAPSTILNIGSPLSNTGGRNVSNSNQAYAQTGSAAFTGMSAFQTDRLISSNTTNNSLLLGSNGTGSVDLQPNNSGTGGVRIGDGAGNFNTTVSSAGAMVLNSSLTTTAATVTGNVTEQTANGGQWVLGSISELMTLSTSGTTTDSAANLLPANSIIESVVARVTTTITTATDWKLGDATTSGRFSAANAVLTAGTTQVGTVQADQTGAPGPRQVAAAKLRITTTGTPGAGIIRVTVFYRQFVPQTS